MIITNFFKNFLIIFHIIFKYGWALWEMKIIKMKILHQKTPWYNWLITRGCKKMKGGVKDKIMSLFKTNTTKNYSKAMQGYLIILSDARTVHNLLILKTKHTFFKIE